MARRSRRSTERRIREHKMALRALQANLDPQGTGRRKRVTTNFTWAETERRFREHAAAAGWRVSKRGWPDFILRRGKRIVFVEVKSHDEIELKVEQQQIAELLADAGFEVFRWDPVSGFRRIERPTP